MFSYWRYLCFDLILVSNSYVSVGQAQDEPPVENTDSVFSRPALFDGSGTLREAMRQHGINADLWWTQFNQSFVDGNGNSDWEYGGKVDLIVNLDASKLGLWHGFSINLHQEWLYGEDANAQGDGTFLPVNTALALPRLGGNEAETSILLTQQLGDRASLSLGKFNMLAAAARTPLVGGGGLDTFMHIALAAPVSGVTPPYLLGASASLKTDHASYNLLVYDPRNAQYWDVIEKPFRDGVTTSLSATFPVKVHGRSGFHTVRGVYSTEDGIDLRDVPQLGLPPELQDEPRSKSGPWYLQYSFQQFLHQSEADPSKGWGIFGQFAISGGNPNPAKGHFFIGLGGNSFLPGRLNDRWGIAYFQNELDPDLRAAARRDLGISLGSEKGVEAYYNLAVTPWLRVTGDLQVVNPFPSNRDRSVFAGLRTQVRF
jgi:porin